MIIHWMIERKRKNLQRFSVRTIIVRTYPDRVMDRLLFRSCWKNIDDHTSSRSPYLLHLIGSISKFRWRRTGSLELFLSWGLTSSFRFLLGRRCVKTLEVLLGRGFSDSWWFVVIGGLASSFGFLLDWRLANNLEFIGWRFTDNWRFLLGRRLLGSFGRLLRRRFFADWWWRSATLVIRIIIADRFERRRNARLMRDLSSGWHEVR